MEIVILATLILLIALVIVLLIRGKSEDVSSKIDASLKEQFLSFQTNIHNELNNTRKEVSDSKDFLSKHTVKTIETMKDMGSTVHKLVQQQEEAQKLGQSLKDLLQTPKLRGSYGEVILEEMLDNVLPKGVWERQYSINGLEKVDAVIKLKDAIVPIDAKFPRDDYQKYMEAETEAEKRECWKGYENALKIQIKSISSKYIKPEQGTTDFAFMFIPSEAIYYETIADKNYLGEESKLFEFAQANKVVPVSPNSFYAHLKVILLGFQNVEILKSTRKLQKGLASVERNFNLFYKKYEDIGKHLDKASESYRVGDSHIGTYKRKLDSTLALEGPDEELDAVEAATENTTKELI